MRSRTEKASGRPTMTDVAKAAGVSQATVSMVLNGTGGARVNEKTRDLVREAAAAIGYRVTQRAQVGAGALQAIGFVIDDNSSNPIVNKAIDAARQLAWEMGAVLIILPVQGDDELRRAALEMLFVHRVIGVVFAAYYTREYALPRNMPEVPIALINCFAPDGAAPAILPAHARGAEAAVRHLIEKGHRRIGFINGEGWMLAAQDRARGYRRALRKAGLAVAPELVRHGNWQLSAASAETRALMALADPPTAIFCASDDMAIGAYEALKNMGLRIPEDVSVVGFDDQTTARHLEPPLTTVLVPHDDMGRRAISHLLAERGRLPAENAVRGRLQIDCPLVLRGSVRDLTGG